MTAAQEWEIIGKVLSGDKNAYEELVIRNQTKVYNLALKMLGNENDALDVSQDVFIKAFIKLSSFRAESRFSVWLYRMTYNLCIDHIRKESRIQKIPLTYDDERQATGEIPIPDPRPQPEDVLINSEARADISSAINKLGDKYREILILRELSGMSYSELAETLKINEGTVKSRITRARKSLTDLLRNTGNGTLAEKNRLNSGISKKEAGEDA